jgi:hypothetical protein
MTITFENDSDVIVYALEKIISFARRNQYLFVANCVWWIAGIIGLEAGLIIHIDNLKERERLAPLEDRFGKVHLDRAQQIQSERAVSSTPWDLTEDRRIDLVSKKAEECLPTNEASRSTRQRNRINPLPQTKNQLKKARNLKRLQEGNRKKEVEQNKRLREIRALVIKNLSKE